jgi:hypothetical protein
MKRYRVILVLLAILSAGCEQPSEIELKRDPRQSMLEVVPVKVPDSLVAVTSVDTSAVLPDDQVNYWGRFVIHHVTLDGGPLNMTSFAYSSVFLSDSSVRFASRFVGFNGLNLGVLALNGSSMVEVPHRIRVRFASAPDTLLIRGVEYVADLSSSHIPNHAYTWTSTSLRFGRFDVSVRSPDRLAIQSPRGGGVYSREKDLPLQWTGSNGKMTIVVSAFDRVSKRSSPLLELRSRENTGSAVIPSSFLKQLPRRQDFVFTFILSNRKDASVIQSQAGRVLVQAASVYNCYIQLP